MTTKAEKIFKNEFPALTNEFSLKPFQEKVINQVIKNGSTLAVMPTGGGKSLIYWITAKALKGMKNVNNRMIRSLNFIIVSLLSD